MLQMLIFRKRYYYLLQFYVHFYVTFDLTDISVGFTHISFAAHCAGAGPMPDSFQPRWKCYLRQWVFV